MTTFLYGMLLLLGLVFVALCCIAPLRRQYISRFLFSKISKRTPQMSLTEREALYAGSVGFEGDLLSGKPDFDRLLALPTGGLKAEEEAFMQGPLQILCQMIDDWDITHNRCDMPSELWEFIKKERFFGMIIPKEYGGLGFSAMAQINILSTLYTRSVTVATTISVPNSLGPAELLLHYGTEAQKNYYLPRLADGREIPCFALTSPTAGSDAASIMDKGIICKRRINDEEVLGILLNWDKRYITLCPVATVIGLAFRLYDPEHFLGGGFDLGISCALIPAHTKGVIRGRRHFPLNAAFMNGPTQGKDVFVPIDALIGGAAMAGKGWKMLMECLAAGRAISLPSSAHGGIQAAALTSGAYAFVRKQFQLPIGKFEGIEEPLARIAANAYMIGAAIKMTAATIDNGAKPAVAGAILKYHATERSRQTALDAMDIHGGKGICLGPLNYLARGYQAAPIAITVEGANILTRSLIIFGQGAVRCHPYIFQELEAIRTGDIKAFDKVFWKHVRFMIANGARTFFFLFTHGRLSAVPKKTTVKKYYQQVARYSAQLAFTTDFCLGLLGGALKRKEKISARLGDVFSYLYLASAVLKQYHDEGEPESIRALVDWSCQHLFFLSGEAFRGVIANFPIRWAGILLKILLQPFGERNQAPSDKLGALLAEILTTPCSARQQLTSLVFKESLNNCPVGRLEEAFLKVHAAEKLEQKVLKAFKEKQVLALPFTEQIEEAKVLGLINEEEYMQLLDMEKARQAVLAVDSFSMEELTRLTAMMATEKHIFAS